MTMSPSKSTNHRVVGRGLPVLRPIEITPLRGPVARHCPRERALARLAGTVDQQDPGVGKRVRDRGPPQHV
jgi:hypothetical protein